MIASLPLNSNLVGSACFVMQMIKTAPSNFALTSHEKEEPFDYEACLARVRDHDEGAARQLVEQLYAQVIGIVRRRIRQFSHASEEDIAQDVFVKMFHKLHQYKGEVPFNHWVSRIATNTALNAIRGLRNRVELRRADLSESEERALEISTSTGPFDSASPSEASAARELLGKLLDRLSPKERLAIELLDVEGHTSEEAAAISGVRASALRARAARARRKLQSSLIHLKPDLP